MYCLIVGAFSLFHLDNSSSRRNNLKRIRRRVENDFDNAAYMARDTLHAFAAPPPTKVKRVTDIKLVEKTQKNNADACDTAFKRVILKYFEQSRKPIDWSKF